MLKYYTWKISQLYHKHWEKFKQLFKNSLDNNKIRKNEYDKIYPKGSSPEILCGNPKIHKPVVNKLPKLRQFCLP